MRLQVSPDVGVFRRLLNELLHPARLAALVETAVAVLIIIVGVRVALHLATVLLRRTVRPDDPRHPPERRAQMRTLVPLLESVLRYLFYFAGLVMILDRLRFNVSAILASAGIAGIAIGFGAQHLIRDIIAGFFLLFEGLIQVGDVVRVGDVTGEVERLSLRTIQLRQFSGELVTIPNGEVQRFGNMNRGFMRAIVHVSLPYGADLGRAMDVMQRAVEAWAGENVGVVLGPPEVQGIIDLGAVDVRLRVVVMVRPGSQTRAERELRRGLLAALEAGGVELPAGVGSLLSGALPGTSPAAGSPGGNPTAGTPITDRSPRSQ
ncbi:MAG: mechanosensitive ion channel [Armatimonadetes bacterium]|nr:mechanosensitive ion channel [Armatimonadota bacterium]